MSVLLTAYNKSVAVELTQRTPLAWGRSKFDPNDQQRVIIDAVSNTDNHVVVQARAGTGKSSTLMLLLPHLAESPSDVTVSTTHSYGFTCWKNANPSRKIMVDGDKLRKIIDAMATEDSDEDCLRNWAFLRKIVSHAQLAGLGIEGAPAISDYSAWLDLVDEYDLDSDIKGDDNATLDRLISKAQHILLESIKQGRDVISFDEMTYLPLYHKVKLRQYDYVLQDELQDQSHVRRMLAVGALRSKTGRMVGTGDRAQAIYHFCGSDSNSMDLMVGLLKSTGKSVTELPLTVTYRCPKSVVRLAQNWVPDLTAHESAKEGTVKAVYLEPENDKQPAFWDCGPFTYSDAVLCRNTKPLVSLAYEFLRRHIPAIVEGREIGAGLIKLAQRWKLKTLNQLSQRLDIYCAKETARFLVKKNESKAAEVEDRCETLQVLIQATKDEGKHNITDLVDLISRMFGDLKEGERPRCLTLCTSHRAKGREWPRVFILGRSKYMPSKYAKQPEQIQQEDNLIYVSVTRAMSELIDVIVASK